MTPALIGVAHRRVVLAEADRTRQRRARRGQEHDRQEQGAHALHLPRLALERRAVDGQDRAGGERHGRRREIAGVLLDAVLPGRPRREEGGEDHRQRDEQQVEEPAATSVTRVFVRGGGAVAGRRPGQVRAERVRRSVNNGTDISTMKKATVRISEP